MNGNNRLSQLCIDVDDIAAVLSLPPDDPVRIHVDACPRCRSLAASYRSFMEAEPVTGADLEKARSMLDARIRADAARWKPAQAPARAFRWRSLLRPAPLLAAAGVLLIAAALFWTTSRPPETGSLRQSGATAQAFALHPAQLATDGSLELGWTPMAGADAYQVRLYGPDFSEIYRSANTTATSMTVNPDRFAAKLPPTLDLTWRVYALSRGDVIATSAPGSIRTR
jgi:hypothetical protein